MEINLLIPHGGKAQITCSPHLQGMLAPIWISSTGSPVPSVSCKVSFPPHPQLISDLNMVMIQHSAPAMTSASLVAD